MSDLSKAFHVLEDMLAGKTDFNGFVAGEGAILQNRISKAAPALQPFLQIAYSGLKSGASSLVAAGETALGPIINAASDTQATLLLNALQAAGIPTAPGTPLNAAEHAALVTIINGLKTMLDRMHINLATPAPSNPQPAAGAAS